MQNRKLIHELLYEQSCNHAKPKEKCDKPKPGATSGGCAYEGAQIALFPFADAAHIVHAPATCIGASWETRATPTSYEGFNNTITGYCTNVTSNDIIFGGHEKVEKAIRYVLERQSPSAVFLYETCVTAMIGDDMDNICNRLSKKYGIPIVPVHAPGFVGSKNLGSKLAGLTVVEKLIGTKEPKTIHPFGINLIGEYNVTGDMWKYSHLLQKIGIKVVSTFSGDGRTNDIRTAHRAKLNVIVCAKSLEAMTKKMQEKFSIPYVSVSFYGRRATTDAIMSIVNAFGDAKLLAKAKEVVREEEAKLEDALNEYKEIFKGKKAILNTGGNKSWSVAMALQDIGLEVVATSVRKATLDDVEEAKKHVKILMKVPANEQAKLIDEHGVDILLAGGRSLYTAIKKRVAFIDVNQEKEVSYGAYSGLLNLAQDVANSLNNPVFKNVAKDAPWNSNHLA